MSTGTDLRLEVGKLTVDYGKIFLIKYLNISGGSAYYDDSVTYTTSGTAWYSGIFLPLNRDDNVLMSQGIIHPDDTKMYITGDILTSGTITIQEGSPTGTIYSIVPLGKGGIDIGTDTVYHTLYLRRLPTGSLLGE